MKADATITEKTIKLGKKNDQSTTVCQALKKTRQIYKSKSQKHCLKRTRNSRESSATIYKLQKIMNIEVPLNVQHLKPIN